MDFLVPSGTACLFDPWQHLAPKRRKLMEQSWAGLFRQEILVEPPVDKIAALFPSGWGRPSKELYTVLGVLVLQQMHDLSDAETVSQLAFNEHWHYALNITAAVRRDRSLAIEAPRGDQRSVWRIFELLKEPWTNPRGRLQRFWLPD